MSELRVDNIVDMGGSGAPQLRKGANVTGISTITQAVVGNATINAGGINATGIVTSSSNKFVGDFASGNITAGVMTATSSVVASNITINSGGVNASGIVSATSYQGSGLNLTGIGLTIAPLVYSPEIGATDQALQPTIELSVNQRIKVGVGSVSLRMVSAGSTVAETFGLGISTSTTYTVTVAGGKFYLDGNLQYSPTLYPGGIYTFDQSAGTNGTHPLRFATAADAAGSTEYTTGVETNGTPGSSGAYTRITVAADAPDTLYYYCTNHSGMGSNVSIGNNVSINNDGTLPKLSFTPVSDLSVNSVIFVDIPSGSFTKMDGTDIAATNWTFTTSELFEAWVWGINLSQNLGQNNEVKYSSPVQLPGTNWKTPPWIYASSTFWIKGDSTLWAIGANTKGQLGQNNLTQRSSPVQISGTTWRSAAEFDSGNGVATKTDGTLWIWGNNESGQLGQNLNADNVDLSSPVQIPGTTWGTVLSGGFHSCHTVKTDGTLWGWGSNAYGNLGQNDRTQRSSPVQIPGTWSKINGGDGSMFGIKTDNTLWAWGKNGDGQLGQNNIVQYSSPVQIGSGTNWIQSSGGNNNYHHLKTDGTLWAIGSGNYGQLGQNANGAGADRSSPVQIPGTTWKQVGGRHYSTYAVKTDGTLWTWGSGNNGAHGQNNTVDYSSPVQVPGTTWMEVSESSGWQTTVAFKALS
jgi:alpha-tubulin suppressor-like RCC1 family protein